MFHLWLRCARIHIQYINVRVNPTAKSLCRINRFDHITFVLYYKCEIVEWHAGYVLCVRCCFFVCFACVCYSCMCIVFAYAYLFSLSFTTLFASGASSVVVTADRDVVVGVLVVSMTLTSAGRRKS